MSLFRSLFSFSKQEVDQCFKKAHPLRSCKGLKVLQCSEPLPDFPSSHGKLLIIASRKVGKAHDRNKIRRQLKEIFYTNNLYQKPVRSIVLVYKSALQLSFEQLTHFFVECFRA